jgi:ribokinase
LTQHSNKLNNSPEVIVVGDTCIDIVARVESYPPIGGDAQPIETTLAVGGTALNTAIMLRRLGINLAFCTRVGADLLGDFACQALQRNGIALDYVQRDPATLTGLVYVAVTPDGQRTMLGGAGANRHLAAEQLPLNAIRQARWLHVGGYTLLDVAAREAAWRASETANAANVAVSLDLSDALMRLAAEQVVAIAPYVEVLLPSGDAGRDLPIKAHGIIARKLGASGCVIVSDDGCVPVPALCVAQVVDTTGAGDAFNAGFIAGRVRGLDVRASALLANACGAAAVTVLGAGNALPTREVVIELLRDDTPEGWQAEAQHILRALPGD